MSLLKRKNNGQWETIAFINQTIPNGTIQPQKIAVPSRVQQVIIPDTGYLGLGSVIVQGDSHLLPENIKKGVTIFGVEGTSAGSSEQDEILYLVGAVENEILVLEYADN